MAPAALHARLALLSRLVDLARAGALFPDARRIIDWLSLLARPWEGRSVPRVELHATSGFPTRRSLDRLLERQRLARAFFAAHRARPRRATDEFNTALAAAELFQPGTAVRPVAYEPKLTRLLVVHDRLEPGRGFPQRFSVQLAQRPSGKHVRVERDGALVPSRAFLLAVEQACDADASACALRLDALDGLEVVEAVQGALGPFELRAEGQAVLHLLLERVGSTVSADAMADAWPEPDAYAKQRAERGWRRSRERKLICTPGLEAGLRAQAAGSRMLVRSR